MKNLLLISLFLSIQLSFSQNIQGIVVDTLDQNLANVNVYIENTYKGTTTNFDGIFVLNVEDYVNRNMVFKYLGYETQKISISDLVKTQNPKITLKATTTNLDEVVVKSGENPAIAIIQNAIDNREVNLAKRLSYKADFYSKGLWKVENVPEKILGQDVGDLGGSLDSTRSGIVYLSETASKIAFQAPNKFKERITASKISGNDNGFSFNSAQDFNLSFYKNTININVSLVSPIADYAFDYYDYELENVFYEENGFVVNKIKVTPKRQNDKAFSGYIFVIDETWELYGVDLNTTGDAIDVAPLENLNFKQNFSFNSGDEFWVILSQSFEFNWKIFGISGSGRFLASYKNYDFKPNFDKGFFTNEIISFDRYANQKDSLFWQKIRPLPLTQEEVGDYQKKDSVQAVRQSKTYKDSIDKVNNKFKLLNPIFGYTYQNSTKNTRFGYTGLDLIDGINFNTVQGFNFETQLYFRQLDSLNTYNHYWQIESTLNYGRADERFRPRVRFVKKFNNFSRPFLAVEGGVEATEINSSNTTSNLIFNTAALFFEENFLKLYDRQFIETSYSEEVLNGIRASGKLSYQRRKALINQRNSQVFRNDNGGFTSNNPLAPDDFGSILFPTHHILKFNLGISLRFNQKYTTTPRGKYNSFSNKFPLVRLNFEKGFGATVSSYDYDFIKMNVRQNLNFSRFGEFGYSLHGGYFLNADGISFLDFKHFDGNETRVGTGLNYLDKFNLLGYYERSTNQSYSELHLEHNFKGFVMNRLPLLKHLKSNLIIGHKSLLIDGRKPYHELSVGLDRLGFGKFKFFRLDYVKPFNGGWQDGAIIFGLKFLGGF